jgi:hypothetical protein
MLLFVFTDRPRSLYYRNLQDDIRADPSHRHIILHLPQRDSTHESDHRNLN